MPFLLWASQPESFSAMKTVVTIDDPFGGQLAFVFITNFCDIFIESNVKTCFPANFGFGHDCLGAPPSVYFN